MAAGLECFGGDVADAVSRTFQVMPPSVLVRRACKVSGPWGVLAAMHQTVAMPDVVAYNAAISACEKVPAYLLTYSYSVLVIRATLGKGLGDLAAMQLTSVISSLPFQVMPPSVLVRGACKVSGP